MSRSIAASAVVGFVLAVFLAGLSSARAEVVITVNKSTQRLSVAVDGVREYEWPVSTARWGYRTPNGTYRPQRLARKWYSRKYHMSPMPYSIFFHGGYAIHGSYEVSYLGQPASHGCIRLLPKHAAMLFKLVSANRGDTEIVVTGERQSYRAVARRNRERTRARQRDDRNVERRARGPQVGFENAFAPSPATFGAAPRAGGGRYRNWDQMLNESNPGQRALRHWWYNR